MNNDSQIKTEAILPPLPRPRLTIKTFGAGSAGLNILQQLANDGVPPASLIAVHSDDTALSACLSGEKIHVANKSARVSVLLDTAGVAAAAAEDSSARLKSLCSGADVIFVAAGLGGALGTSLSTTIAIAAREAGAFVIAFVILPFECEGSLRAQNAEAGLKQLKEAADLVVCWSNQKTLGLIPEGTSLLNTYTVSNHLLASCLRGAWRALESETAMGVNFLDLCASIRERSTECVFSLGESSGANRALEAVERALDHPMLSTLDCLQKSQAIAVSVLGGPSLAMAEVDRIMAQLKRHCDAAPVLMGAGINQDLGESLLIVMLLAAPAEAMDAGTESVAEDNNSRSPRATAEPLGAQLLGDENTRRHSRFVPPPPALPAEKMAQLLKQQARGGSRLRQAQSKLRQTQLPLEILSKGRFDKSEPTIHKGEDLDVPTYIRRGMALN